MRVRPEGAQKFTTFILQTQTEKRAFAVTSGEFGELWVRNYKVEELKKLRWEYAILPSINEVLEGLLLWKVRQIEAILAETKNKSQRMRAIKNTRSTFTEIFHLMEFTNLEMEAPMERS